VVIHLDSLFPEITIEEPREQKLDVSESVIG
jgi:hypothetical protein